MLVLCKGIFSYRITTLFGYTLQGGQLIAPFWFLISDMIAELYGYESAISTIKSGFICQILFTLCAVIIINLPMKIGAEDIDKAYYYVFSDMWRVDLSVLIAFIVSGFINIKLLVKLKIMMQGKYFWLRSIGASGVGELIFSVLATTLIQYGKQSNLVIMHMVIISFLLKLIYSTTLALPANFVIFIIKGDHRKTFINTYKGKHHQRIGSIS